MEDIGTEVVQMAEILAINFALWAVPLVALDRLTVWGRLVARYPAHARPSWQAWFRSGQIGWVQMNRFFCLSTDERGLFLAWGLPFLHSRVLHLPWEAMAASEERIGLFQIRVTRLTVPALPKARIALQGHWLEKFAQASGGRFPVAS